jgi:hypothetical protein
MHVCTSIGREYAIALKLGFSVDDLLSFTRNAVAASFTTPCAVQRWLRELET